MKKLFMAVIALMMTISASAQFYIYCSDGNVIKVDSISMIAPTEAEDPTQPDNPTTPSAGIGTFSVSATKQVTFSKGNLQYTQSTKTWSFASAQYEVLGTDNVIGGTVTSDEYGYDKSGTALADKVDLFGWGTGDAPTKSSTDYSDYQTFVDWGTNQIGADAPNTWRTLSNGEWGYLFNTRTNASSLYGVAQVNGVNGMVVLPDDWTCPEGVTFKSGLHSEYVSDYSVYQSFTTEQWSKMEQAGAVFLPTSGSRLGTDVGSGGNYGIYWSSTEYDEDFAYSVGFYSDGLYPQAYSRRYLGLSVRLAQDL